MILGDVANMDNAPVPGVRVEVIGHFRAVPAPAADQEQRPLGPQPFRQIAVCSQEHQHVLPWLNRAQKEQVLLRQSEPFQNGSYLRRRQRSEIRPNAVVAGRHPLGADAQGADHFLPDEFGHRQEVDALAQAAAEVPFEIRDPFGRVPFRVQER